MQIECLQPGALFARALGRRAAAARIAGDAALASDIQWLVDNLRWDVEADLERVFGPVVAHQLARLGSSLAAGLRGLARARRGRSRLSQGEPRGNQPAGMNAGAHAHAEGRHCPHRA